MNDKFKLILLISAAGLLSACDRGSSSIGEGTLPATPAVIPPSETYDLQLSNLTYGQPLSPAAYIMTSPGYVGWQMGASAGAGLEQMAEGGDASNFVTEAAGSTIVSEIGAGPIGPGGSETVMLTTGDTGAKALTVASMLVNTNDGFTGVTNVDISGMIVNESRMFMLPVFDAGTEANSSAAGTIPGPQDGGEGYNTARDDIDIITRHPGVATLDGINTGLVLTEAARFDGPVARLTVTRTE